MNGDDIPQRCIDGVVLGLGAIIGEAVREHALGYRLGPTQQNLFGLIETPCRQTESSQGDKRVASPIGEPRVTSDDRWPAIPLH